MTPVTTFAGKEVALFGLGGSGLVTAMALQAGGAKVTACDDNASKMWEVAATGIPVADLRDADWSKFDAFILSPGVPLTHPAPHWTVELARKAGVEIIGDIELFCRERAALAAHAPFIAITGTNGKSTTTALIAHILRENGFDVQMGGNIGTAILALEPPAANRVHVIECSTFQIDLAPSLNPSIGVLLNVTPDHLDRHGTMDQYAAIKERLVAKADNAVVSVDDDYCRAVVERIAEGGKAKLVRFATETRMDVDVSLYSKGSAQVVVRSTIEGLEDLADISGIAALRGRHNGQNAVAAAAVLMAAPLSLSVADIDRTIKSFPGLAHRMEQLGSVDDVLFINDSKATNADSTEKALASFDRVFWIVGGKQKEGGIALLEPYFSKIDCAYLIGASSDAFAATLEGKVPFRKCETMDKAVALAAADAAAACRALPEASVKPVVLLSPACASYDQYPNFEVRGDHFRKLVQALPGFGSEVN